MSEMNGNPHFADQLIDYSATGDGRAVSALVASLSYEQRTANLIAFYNTHSLYESLDDAERYAIHKEIIERIGAKNS